MVLRLESLEFSSLTSKLLWAQLTAEAKSRYSFDFNCDDIKSFIETYGVRRTCILRSLCLKTGLQLTMREYQFESPSKSSRSNAECFNEDDIVNIYPIIRQVPPKPSDAYQFFTSEMRRFLSCFAPETSAVYWSRESTFSFGQLFFFLKYKTEKFI